MFRRAFFVLFILFQASFVYAKDQGIVINAFQIGGSTSTDEFIEIYNPSLNKVNLSGWRISKKTASGAISNLLTTFPDVEIYPNSSLIISHKDFSGKSDVYYSTSGSIAANNTIVLFSDNGKTVVDKVGFGEAIDFEEKPIAETKNSVIYKRTDFADTDNNFYDFSLPDSGMETGSEEEPPTLTENFFDIRITEIMPNPVGSDAQNEWIELCNFGGRVDLGGIKVRDKLGKTKEYFFPLGSILEPNQYFFLLSGNSGISLNNDGDIIEVVSVFGKVIDSSEVNYGNSKEGSSFALVGTEWFWTTKPTPGSINIIESLAENKAAAKNSSKKTASTKTAKKAGKVLGAVVETAPNNTAEKLLMEKNDRTLGIILIVVALIGGLLYTLYINKEKLIAVFIKERKRYDKSWEAIRKRFKRG